MHALLTLHALHTSHWDYVHLSCSSPAALPPAVGLTDPAQSQLSAPVASLLMGSVAGTAEMCSSLFSADRSAVVVQLALHPLWAVPLVFILPQCMRQWVQLWHPKINEEVTNFAKAPSFS